MAIYGFRLRNKHNRIIYDTSSITTMYLDAFVVTKTVTKTYKNMTGFRRISVAFQTLGPLVKKGNIPTYTANISGDTGTLTIYVPLGAERVIATVLVQ